MEFRLLGPLEVVGADGGALPLGGRRPRSVLALLLLHRGQVVPSERIVDALWGERPPKAATTSLQNCVSQLRRVVGADRIETRSPGYVLRAVPEEVDVERFRRLVDEAREADPPHRARRLAEALALWRGPALADLAYEAFARTECDRLEELRLAAVEERLAAELESGRDAELLGDLELLVSEHPLRERLREFLMLALYRSGRQADALSAYQQARRALLGELGIDPSPSLQRLHAAMLRQDRGLEPPAEARDGTHLEEVARALAEGRLVPVVGSDSTALAHRLAERFEYPPDDVRELARVAQYAALMRGSGPLRDELAALLEDDSAPGPVHRFLAALPPLLRDAGKPHQLIVTTGHGLALERAFLDAGEEVDVVSYVADGPDRGKFCHIAPGAAPRLVDVPNRYATELSLERRTVILKLHGGLGGDPGREVDGLVVTEDDHIEYLGEGDLVGAIPVALTARLRRSHLLFLGYGVREWNLRAVLSRVWGSAPHAYRSWAVSPAVPPVERQTWRVRGIDLVDAGPDEYVEVLGLALGLEQKAAV